MGIHRGPNTVKDNLVFGYDTGYGIADNSTATRFYKGKPTTNIASGAAFIHDTSSGSAGSCVDAPEKGPGWKKVTITAIGSNFRVVQFGSYPSLTANITYSSSFEVDWGNMRGKGYTLTQDGSGGGTRNYFINGSYASGVTGVTINSSLLDGHIGMNIVKTANHVHVPFIYNTGSTSTTGRNDYFYYKEYQQEVGTIPTPYVDGTRSSTASLIDLKRTASIDVSNVSFDSTGQPEFDGTDDYIVTPDSDNYTFADAVGTWEACIRATGNTGVLEHNIMCKANYALGTREYQFQVRHSGGVYYIYLGQQNNNTSWKPIGSTSTSAININEWYHVIVTSNGSGNAQMYINGDLKTSATGWHTSQTNLGAPLCIGATINSTTPIQEFVGDIAVCRLYKKHFSQQEALQNYNAYKNRFDI